MKLFILMILFTVNAFAAEVSFKCDFTDVTYVNQFSLEAKNVQIEDGKFSNTELDFSLRKAGSSLQTERLVVTRDGTAQFLRAGELYRHPITRLVSAAKGAEVEYINLLIDVSTLHSSQIRFLNGATFFGSCKSI